VDDFSRFLAGSIPAVSTTEQKNWAPSASLGPNFFVRSRRVGGTRIRVRNGRGVELGFRAACDPPAERRPLASGRLFDSPIPEIARRFRAASAAHGKLSRNVSKTATVIKKDTALDPISHIRHLPRWVHSSRYRIPSASKLEILLPCRTALRRSFAIQALRNRTVPTT